MAAALAPGYEYASSNLFNANNSIGKTWSLADGPQATDQYGRTPQDVQQERILYFGKPRYDVRTPFGWEQPNENLVLPHAWEGSNYRVTAVIFAAITEAEQIFTRHISPIEKWSGGKLAEVVQFFFDKHHLDVVPEQGVVRMLTQHRRRWQEALKRYGLGFQMEDGFAMTPMGKKQYAQHILQIRDAILETMRLIIIDRILTAPRQAANALEAVGVPNTASTLEQLIQAEVDGWAICAKENGFLQMKSMAKRAQASNRNAEPFDTLILPNGLLDFYRWKHPEETRFMDAGPGGPALLDTKAGPIGPKASEFMVTEFPRIFMGEGNPVTDISVRFRTIGEFFQMDYNFHASVKPQHYSSQLRQIRVHDNNSDQMVELDFMQALDACGFWDPAGNLSNEGKIFFGSEHQTFRGWMDAHGLNSVFNRFLNARDISLREVASTDTYTLTQAYYRSGEKRNLSGLRAAAAAAAAPHVQPQVFMAPAPSAPPAAAAAPDMDIHAGPAVEDPNAPPVGGGGGQVPQGGPLRGRMQTGGDAGMGRLSMHILHRLQAQVPMLRQDLAQLAQVCQSQFDDFVIAVLGRSIQRFQITRGLDHSGNIDVDADPATDTRAILEGKRALRNIQLALVHQRLLPADVTALIGVLQSRADAFTADHSAPLNQLLSASNDTADVMAATIRAIISRGAAPVASPDLRDDDIRITDVTRDFLRKLWELDIMIPFNALLFRPWMTYEMGTAVFMKRGVSTMVTLWGNENMQLSHDGSRKMLMGNYTAYGGVVIKQPANIFVYNNATCNAYVRGGGTTFYDYNTIKMQTQFSNMAKNKRSADIFVALIPASERIRSLVLDLTGEFPASIMQGAPSATLNPFYSSAPLVRSMYKFQAQKSYFGTLDDMHSETANYNSKVFQATQYMYRVGTCGELIPNGCKVSGRGHWGKVVYAGVRADRCASTMRPIRDVDDSNCVEVY